VRDKIVTELKQQKSALLARTKAEDLAKRVKAGEKFEAAAKSSASKRKPAIFWLATARSPAPSAASKSPPPSSLGPVTLVRLSTSAQTGLSIAWRKSKSPTPPISRSRRRIDRSGSANQAQYGL